MNETSAINETCLRCEADLDTPQGYQTGICPDCWVPEDEDPELPLIEN